MTQEQFTQTYLPFSGKMYALAYNLLRNRDEARDCVQDVFAELWQRRADIEQDKPPLPLLLTMDIIRLGNPLLSAVFSYIWLTLLTFFI